MVVGEKHQLRLGGRKINKWEHQQWRNTDRTPYLFNGKELDEETGLYYYGARYYDPKTSVWQSVDPKAEEYPAHSPFNFSLNNPINAKDPDGRKVIFVNGHYQDNVFGDWLNIERKKLEAYWGKRFIDGARNFLNDHGSTQFIDGSSMFGGDMDGADRYEAGYKFAESNYKTLISDLKEREAFNMVTSSEGAAYGAGVAAYLLEKGHKVETVVHLSPDEGDDFSTPEGPLTYQLDFEGDFVTGNERVKGVDKRGTVKDGSISEAHGRHRSSTVWNKVKDLASAVLQLNLDGKGKSFYTVKEGTTSGGTKFVEVNNRRITE